jgi:hypothetical protein
MTELVLRLSNIPMSTSLQMNYIITTYLSSIYEKVSETQFVFRFGIYLLFCLLFSVPVFMVHVAVVGGLLCGLSYLRLPPPDPVNSITSENLCDVRNASKNEN